MKRKILLNPGPATTTENVKNAMVVEDICPREGEFGQVMHDICDGLLKIGNGQDKYKVGLFGASGTGAMEAVLSSAIGNEDKVLIITNGAYGFRMAKICDKFGIAFDTEFQFGDYPEVGVIADKLETSTYSHLIMIHHETSTGMMNPLDEVAELCNSKGVKLILDAMSTFGACPIDLSAHKIDYLISSSNKGIHGMAGLSYVIFHEDCMPELQANARGFYFDLYAQWKNLQDKNQLRFTPPVQVCYAFKAAIDETLEETVAKRWERYTGNWQLLYDGLQDMGFDFFLPLEQQSRILLAINLNNKSLNFEEFHDFLYARDVTIYPGVIPESATFRVSVIGDLYKEDIEYALTQMREYFQKS